MPALLQEPLRASLRRVKAILKSSGTVRSLLADLDNLEEFANLYEHEQMIADAVRVDSYRKAIARNIKAGDVVIDLGTGTGILAFFAAQQQAGKIYAIDHSPFIGVAERIAKHNNFRNVVFVRANSRAFVPAEPVDVILHEQIGDDLFDENMLENLLDLKKRVLKQSGRILPGKFELFIEPVSLKRGYRVPYLWESRIHGIDFRFLKGTAELAGYMRGDHDRRYLRWGALEHFLCDPTPLLSVDLNEISDARQIPSRFEVSRKVVRCGSLDGLCLYFRVIFDGETSFDTSPARAPTHWGNRLFRMEAKNCQQGDTLSYRIVMEDFVRAQTWSIRVD
jgi:protein arginine N-methyltransferase 1